jgi:ADP-heptose:LPS heptosyltransferase/GT2 family glycosyltransferase
MLTHARQSGFALDSPVAGRRSGTRRLTLQVRLENGELHDQEIRLAAARAGPRDLREMAGDAERMLQIDSPVTVDGVVAAPVRGNLEISGWAVARPGVAAIEIALDGSPLATATYGLRRLDIRDALPAWKDALTSGFSALLPHRLLPAGEHAVTVTLRDREGESASLEFRIAVEDPAAVPGPWALRSQLAPAEAGLAARLLDASGRRPIFVAVLPVAGDREGLRHARVTIESLRVQEYAEWRLLIVGGGGRLAEIDGTDERCAMVPEVTSGLLRDLAARSGVAPADMFVTLLTPGDRLGCDALLEMALAAAAEQGADFLYSDERRVNPASGSVEAWFKPQWSPDLLLATNYVGRAWCARADLVASVAADTEPLLAGGEYDLVLRCTERAAAIRHLPAVLRERAAEPPSAAREKTALAGALARRGVAGEVGDGLAPGTYRLKRALTRPGLVSIIIPTCAARGMIETCIGSLRRLTTYRDYEIVCIENIPAAERKWRQWLRRHADRVISTKERFNWSRFNNLAAAEARGEYLLFLNDDVEIVEPGWLETLLAQAQRPEIGAVGPRLLYPDRRVQHAGMFLAAMGQARHAFRHAAEDDPGYFGLALTERNVIAVTGACLLTRREVFDALGGFDEAHAVINNDIDYCLTVRQRGLFTVYTPHATLIHHEAASRAGLADDYEATAFERQWRDVFLAGDPFFHAHLSKDHDDVTVEHEPTGLVVTGRPGLRRAAIRNILVVKLDHIGDCVIAFPALRRLKQHFPDARITVLTSQSSLPLWQLEPSVDRTIVFDFFHARSALGEIGLSDDDWRRLRERLVSERFDLAVDLRKHIETRPVLQHSGARYLAGFDFRNQFPWLDVSLEWTGDQMYARKRQHNGDDLVNLVDAIAAACEGERSVIDGKAWVATGDGASGKLVCVHPTAGNEMKQWPVVYFAAVIDRLIEEDNARVVLIGAPGEEATAAELLAQVRNRNAVRSLVGKVPLAELPSVLREAALFLGNDSGPKHLAAGLGVPTVGVHAGTVDVREWGPMGPAAVSVTRSVICSPCYLSEVEDCRRGLACLRQLAPAQVYAACKRLLLLAGPKGATARAEPAKPRRPRRRASPPTEIRP